MSRRIAGPPVGRVVWMSSPPAPHPEGVKGRQQDAPPVSLTQPKQNVPQCDHGRPNDTCRPFKMAAVPLAILQHQPQARDAMLRKHAQISLRTRAVAAPYEPAKI